MVDLEINAEKLLLTLDHPVDELLGWIGDDQLVVDYIDVST